MNWPNQSDEYRCARDAVLQAESELRRREEAVAAQRRALPLGGEVSGDYTFDSPTGPVAFGELFTSGKPTLYLYNFMFIPGGRGRALEVACPSCTSIIDAMDGAFRHLRDRVDVAVVAKVPIEQFAAWGKERGWRFTPLYSSAHSTFNRDFNAEAEDGSQFPVAHVFRHTDGRIHHHWSSELWAAPREEGQHPRHVDYMWPIWKVLDLIPEGRGTDWNPRYDYGT
jgi:predicted dithiol-disulfide oxidoreductase (DUF899 family)